MNAMRTARYALYCGTAAGLASMAAVVVAGWLEGGGAVRPINATSHFLWGEKAARTNDADLRHTMLGVITNQAAGTFWGTLFGAFLASRPPRTPLGMLRDAAIMGAVAGVVDYGIAPKRLTPGWELAVSMRSVAISFAAMSVGLAAGGLLAQRGDQDAYRATRQA
jgi:hypothetical protein